MFECRAGEQGGTYCGNPLMCAAAWAVLDAVTAAGFLAEVQARSAQWRQGLDALARRLGVPPVQGRGLLLALQLPGEDAATRLAARLLARADSGQAGMLVNAVRPQRLRFMPALNMQADEVSLALVWLESALFP